MKLSSPGPTIVGLLILGIITALAADLLKEYAYPTQEEFAAGKRGVKDTVEYFADQLYKIGYLSTESSKLIDKLYTEVDVDAK